MSSVDVVAKQEALSHIFDAESGHTLIVALDDSSISGPEAGLRDMEDAVSRARDNGANAVIGFRGLFKHFKNQMGDMAGILNLTLSTEGPRHLEKVLVGHAEAAKRLGVTAVSVHVNTTAPTENEMLTTLGFTAEICEELGIPLLAHMYPRTIKDGQETHYEDLRDEDPEAYARLVRQATRIAADQAVDIIKVPFTGNADTFHSVVESAYGIPVVMAGGPRTTMPGFLKNAESALEAGAKGIAVGRNFFQQPVNPEQDLALLSLHGMLHRGYDRFDAVLRAEGILAGRISAEIEEGIKAGRLIPGVSSLEEFDQERTFYGVFYGLDRAASSN